MSSQETIEKHDMAMLRRFADAGEWGIRREFVPDAMLCRLQDSGYVTKLLPTPVITEEGLLALSQQDIPTP